MRGRDNQSISDPLMGAFRVIVLQILLDDMIQVLITETDELVECSVHHPDVNRGDADARAFPSSVRRFSCEAPAIQGAILRCAILLTKYLDASCLQSQESGLSKQ
jgi:hypothetical protein